MNKNKIISLVLIFVFIFALTANAAIYEEKTETVITKGVTLTNLKQFTAEGWQNINIVKADLSEKYISADVIIPSEGIDSLETVKSMASTHNSVAAINGDFFSWSGSTGKKGSSIGTLIKNGILLSGAYEIENTCATLAITDTNQVLIDFVTTDITVTAPNGESAKIKQLNKYDSLAEICIYTSDFKEITEGSMNNILEMVIKNGRVIEMRREKEGVKVPENGYVIRHLPEFDPFLTDNFKVGDNIEIDIKTSLDLNKIKSAVGGGTKLVENGKPAKITHNISGVNPRTVAGTDKSGNVLYLITIDGRQNKAVGMTLEQTAEFLIEYGVYNAINFDGGGSTTMVAKTAGIQSVINLPSQSSLRPVANGLGIFSTAPKGTFASFDIETDSSVMLKNTSKEFDTGLCYDNYHNVIDTDTKNVTWSVDKNYGYFKDNIFYATNSGDNIEITAKIGNVTSRTHITVYDEPVRLTIHPSHFNKEEILTSDFSVTGYDKNGYSAKIDNRDVIISSESKGEIGSKKVTVSKAYGFVSYSASTTENFEKTGFSHSVYPLSSVSGEAVLSEYLSRSGEKSAMLSYDFTSPDNVTKASYLILDVPKVIDSKSKTGVWVYSPGPSGHMIKAQLRNDDNELLTAVLCESIDFTGWKYLTAKLPKGASTLNTLYVVQNNTSERTKGFILFDDLTLFDTGEISFSEIKTPFVPAEKQQSGYMTFIVTGKLAPDNTLLSKVLNTNIKKVLENENANYCWSLDGVSYKDLPVITIDGYKSFSEKGNLFINLNNSDGYLSNAQFEKLANDIRTQSYTNLFVFMNEDPSLMTDKSELTVLKALLGEAAESKNVFAFYSADGDNIYKEDNVNYVAVKGINKASALEISQNKDNLTYVKTNITNNGVKINFEKIIK
ncbi:MAG: phosphodiester glycosidase family protein [Clostridia bacterium]|nr:phosphodiester glycosidase family protein [Clostridia bacterium]